MGFISFVKRVLFASVFLLSAYQESAPPSPLPSPYPLTSIVVVARSPRSILAWFRQICCGAGGIRGACGQGTPWPLDLVMVSAFCRVSGREAPGAGVTLRCGPCE